MKAIHNGFTVTYDPDSVVNNPNLEKMKAIHNPTDMRSGSHAVVNNPNLEKMKAIHNWYPCFAAQSRL